MYKGFIRLFGLNTHLKRFNFAMQISRVDEIISSDRGLLTAPVIYLTDALLCDSENNRYMVYI